MVYSCYFCHQDLESAPPGLAPRNLNGGHCSMEQWPSSQCCHLKKNVTGRMPVMLYVRKTMSYENFVGPWLSTECYITEVLLKLSEDYQSAVGDSLQLTWRARVQMPVTTEDLHLITKKLLFIRNAFNLTFTFKDFANVHLSLKCLETSIWRKNGAREKSNWSKYPAPLILQLRAVN